MNLWPCRHRIPTQAGISMLSDCLVSSDVVRPALSCFPLSQHVGGGHLLVHLRLDDPVRVVLLDDNEIRVVVLAAVVPQDRQVVDMQS
jgi:hypothetical protein